MIFDWNVVRERYGDHPRVQPLKGGSTLQVVEVDNEQICLKQRLWRDCVSRASLEDAIELLGDRSLPADAIGFAEELRIHLASGAKPITDCSRIPNMSAVILKDLGYLI
jgi:hypothetical protein